LGLAVWPPGPCATGPAVQIHVYENAATSRMTVHTDHGERDPSPAEASRPRCDAVICKPGQRYESTIPPSVRSGSRLSGSTVIPVDVPRGKS